MQRRSGLLLLLSLCAIAQADWRQVNGPTGSATSSVLATENLLLAGSIQGIFRSRDQGISWERRSRDFPMARFAVAGRSILAYSRFFLVRSADEGETWQALSDSPVDSLAGNVATLGDMVFFANGKEVYRSLDQGGTWTKCAQDFDRTLNLDMVAERTALLVRTRDGLYRSLDSGSTWHPAGMGLPTRVGNPDYRSFARSGGYLFIREQGVIYRSNDLGANWVRIPGTPVDTVLSFFDDGSALYVAAPGGLFRSTDQGASFQKVNGGIGYRFRPYDVAHQGGEFWMATEIGIYKSRDQGASFQGSHTGMVGSSGRAFLSEGGRVHVAAEQGFYSSPDLGATWSRSPDSIIPYDISCLAAMGEVLFAGATSHRGVHKSTDRGATWQPASHGVESPVEYVSALAVDGTTLFAVANNGLFRSEDGGGTWSQSGSGLPDPLGPGLIVEGGSLYAWKEKRVFRSTDHGSTWAASGDTAPDPIKKMAAVGSTLIVLGEYSLHVSRDRGATWTTSQTRLQGDFFSAVVATPAGFFVGTFAGKILHSTDSGSTWTPRMEGMEGLDGRLFTVKGFVVAGDHLLAGALGVYKRPLSDFGVVSVRKEGLGPGAAANRPGFALRMLRKLGVDLLGRSMPRLPSASVTE